MPNNDTPKESYRHGLGDATPSDPHLVDVATLDALEWSALSQKHTNDNPRDPNDSAHAPFICNADDALWLIGLARKGLDAERLQRRVDAIEESRLLWHERAERYEKALREANYKILVGLSVIESDPPVAKDELVEAERLSREALTSDATVSHE